MGEVRPVIAALDRAGHRLTGARRLVAELITGRDGPFTAADLVAAARARRRPVGRATIFRSLELLAGLGVVERVDLPSGEHAYVPCEPEHHHHLICARCGRATEVEDCGISAVAREMARRTGYRVDEHRLELFGICPACLAGEGAAPTARGRRRAG